LTPSKPEITTRQLFARSANGAIDFIDCRFAFGNLVR
jgi:hypothetical protein